MSLDAVQNIMANTNGFYVAITNNSNKALIKFEGVEVATGVSANIGITRTFYSKLPSPYSDCRDDVDTPSDSDSDYYRYTVQLGRYTRNQCFEICFQYSYAIANCNCSDPSVVSNVNNVAACSYSLQACLQSQRSSFASSNCEDACPEACERVEYSYKISTSSYPTLYIKNYDDL
jgi:hypothetical protein